MLAWEVEIQGFARAWRKIARDLPFPSAMAPRLRHLLISALALVALALAAPGAAVASGQDVLNDCFDDDALSKEYSSSELRAARRQMEADFEAYSECDDIIDGRLSRRASAANTPGVGDGANADRVGAGANGGGSGGSGLGSSGLGSGAANGSGGAPGSPEEQARKRQLARVDIERQLGERAFDPRDGAAIAQGDTSNGLPLAVLLALIALTVLLLAGGLMALQQRNPSFMGALRRGPFARRGR